MLNLQFFFQNSRRRPIKASLHISGDGLRVVDEDTKGLIVDQTIEKVSFCAPDRNHDRGFSYICRDGTTRRWMCHGFFALKDSGERLSHAVGCAFAVCLERKQRRDKECGVTMTFDVRNSTFTRAGSFRQPTITDNISSISEVNTAIVSPQLKPDNPFAIERPHAAPHLLERQESFRGFHQIGLVSPFKRQMSLRLNDLPSNTARQKAFLNTKLASSPHSEQMLQSLALDSVSMLCQELSQGLSLLSKNEIDDTDLNINIKSPTSIILTENIGSLTDHTKVLSNSKLNSGQVLQHKPSANSQPPEEKIKTIAWQREALVSSNIPIKVSRLSSVNRTKSLNIPSDPFDAEWVTPQSNQAVNTNPFISSS